YVDINGASAIDLGQAYPIMTHPYKFANSTGWVGISHCAVFDDGKDNWYYSSQARFPVNGGGNAPNAVMLGHVRRIVWTEDGWPLVLPERYGAVPQIEISADEIAGTWEHIDLSYGYQDQKASTSMTFGADGKISNGPWKGYTWSFDPAKNLLKTSNGVTLYVSRECDWEASPRKATLVYAATGKNITYWGKKSN
ncbi:MAG: glycoside hydrolase family 43 protein, partial [Bacteroidales bacterium]|nr:glycoside hydrolase family 43 protein [Candidatus Cryptobacteroides caccocaballi]